MEDRNGLVDQLKNTRCYKDFVYDSSGYHLTFSMTNTSVTGSYRSGP